MKTIIITGRLTASPEYKKVGGNETSLTTFSLANQERKDAETQYFDVRCWGALADFAAKYLNKGIKVLISGSPEIEIYKGKDEKNHRRFIIDAKNIEFASSKKPEDTQE